MLAGVQHRGVVVLALADDDHAAHRDGAEHRPNGVDRGAVDLVLVAPAEEPGGGHRRGLGGSDQFQRQDAVVIKGVGCSAAGFVVAIVRAAPVRVGIG